MALLIGAALLRVSPCALPGRRRCPRRSAGCGRCDGGAADDPGWVVIDEFAGQMDRSLPLAARPRAGWRSAFLLFRLFDIAKPGPIGWADRQQNAPA